MSWIRCSALLLTVLITACGGKGQSAAPPSDLTVQSNGDTQVTLNWTPQAGVQYWVLCAPGDSITAKSWGTTVGGNAYSSARDGAGVYNGDLALASRMVTPPFNVTGLRNDVTYSFTVNARTDGGPGGEGAAPVTIKPRLAGAQWSSLGTIPDATAIRAMAFGVPTGKTAYVFVAVGDGGAIYSSTDNQKTWTARSLPTAVAGRRFNDVMFLFSRFIAVGEGGAIVYSPDGVTWTAATINSSTSMDGIQLTAMANSGSTLMAVGQAGTVLTTGDGITWTAQPSSIPQNLHAVAASQAVNANLPTAASLGTFWLVAGDGGAVYTSADGVSWQLKNTGLESVRSAWRGVAVLTDKTSNLDCGLGSPAVTTINTSYSVALVGDDGQVATAGPSLAWTLTTLDGQPRLNRVISPAGQFVAVGNAGAVYTGNLNADASSISWLRRSGAVGNPDLYGVIRYGKDAALAYSNSYIAYGQTGATWFSR